MAMAHQTCLPVLKRFIRKGRHECGQFGMDRLFDQIPCSVAQDLGKWVG